MDTKFAQMLCQLNNDFYRDQAVSFSDTRHAKWPGWERCLKAVSSVFLDQSNSVVLDVACGNLRFEKISGISIVRASNPGMGTRFV